MGDAARKLRATYADIEALPPGVVGELIEGMLYTSRPHPRHAVAGGGLAADLIPPFQRGRGGPGGWWIIPEPELHFPDPTAPGEPNVLVPDLAGWRIERLPEIPDEPYLTVAPDWVCEVLSPSTASVDRGKKMPVYAREGVRHVWLIDPAARAQEVFALGPDRLWVLLGVYDDAAPVRAQPFEAVAIDLAALWARPSRS